jgi:hypothetical protein
MPIIAGGQPPQPPPVHFPEIGFATATYTAPDGPVWPLTDSPRGWFTLADGVSGLGAAPIDVTTDPHPRGGVRVRHVQPAARSVIWPLHIWGQNHMEFVTRFRALARAFAMTSRLGPGVLEIARPDGSRRRIGVNYEQGFEGLGRQGTGIVSDSVVLTLLAQHTYWYDPVPVTTRREAGEGRDFFEPYPSVSSSQVLGETVLVSPADVTVWPDWVISGPASLVTFTHHDRGAAFVLDPAEVSGVLAVGDEVRVTTDPPRVRKLTAEVQTINLGAASAGTITITTDLDGAEPQTTGPIAYDADAETVQAALEELPSVRPGDVTVTGGPLPGTVTLTIAGRYLGTDVPEVTVTPTGLTGGTVTVATVTEGATDNWSGALNWPEAELWPLEPGPNRVSFQLDGSGPSSAVDVRFLPRYETA